jgi:hypothetical protein
MPPVAATVALMIEVPVLSWREVSPRGRQHFGFGSRRDFVGAVSRLSARKRRRCRLIVGDRLLLRIAAAFVVVDLTRGFCVSYRRIVRSRHAFARRVPVRTRLSIRILWPPAVKWTAAPATRASAFVHAKVKC